MSAGKKLRHKGCRRSRQPAHSHHFNGAFFGFVCYLYAFSNIVYSGVMILIQGFCFVFFFLFLFSFSFNIRCNATQSY